MPPMVHLEPALCSAGSARGLRSGTNCPYKVLEVKMSDASSTGFSVLVGLLPFLFFFLFLAFQVRNPRASDAPKVSMYKVVLGFGVLLPVTLCLLLFLLFRPADGAANTTMQQPRPPEVA